MSAPSEPKYWFKAKRNGMGWGTPIAWQGWAVLAIYLGLMAVGPFVFPPRQDSSSFLGYAATLTAAMIVVCWFTGEPPKRR